MKEVFINIDEYIMKRKEIYNFSKKLEWDETSKSFTKFIEKLESELNKDEKSEYCCDNI